MKTTYSDFIRRMKTAFYNECGEDSDDLGDISIRFQCVATELYALSTYQNYLEKQLFVSTAEGENLDIQGTLAGVDRKAASNAEGELTFSVSEPAQSNISIPKGTVCSKEGEPYVQFSTSEAASIPAGQTSVTVKAVSLRQASNVNAPAGTVTVMVNPPAGVESVVNEIDFTGGCRAEGDESYRKRILALRAVPPNGVNASSMAAVIETDDRVLSCRITGSDEAGKVNVYVKTRNSAVDESLKEAIIDKLGVCTLAGCQIEIIPAAMKEVTLFCNAKIYQLQDEETVSEAIKTTVEDYFSGGIVGQNISPEAVLPLLKEIDGVAECQVYSPSEVNGEIACGTGEYLSVSSVEVNCYE